MFVVARALLANNVHKVTPNPILQCLNLDYNNYSSMLQNAHMYVAIGIKTKLWGNMHHITI